MATLETELGWQPAMPSKAHEARWRFRDVERDKTRFLGKISVDGERPGCLQV